MTWRKTREDRRRDDKVYKSPEYLRNRSLAWKRAGARCELITGGRRCGSRDRCQVDHIINVAAGGTHHLDNLRVLCGHHHNAKTAQEGKGYRAGRKPKADPALQARTQW